jgi:hypothetical protein
MPQSTRARFGPSVPRPATAERAQISSWHIKSSDRSSWPTRSAAHSSAASPSAELLGDSIPITNLSRGSQISIMPAGRPCVHPSAVSSLGGFRTPAVELAVPSLMRPASETFHTSGRSHSKSGTAAYLLYFHPTWMGRMARSVSRRALADARSVPARVRRQYHRPAEMRGHCRHERPELDTRADTWPLGLAVTYLPVFSMLRRIAAARFLNN